MTTLELFPENTEEMQLDISFISALMAVENSIKAGRTQGGLWFPHPSPEGGNDTLGYGHKLTNKEVETGQIVVSDGTVINYKDGLTDNFVYALFVSLQPNSGTVFTTWTLLTTILTLKNCHASTSTSLLTSSTTLGR